MAKYLVSSGDVPSADATNASLRCKAIPDFFIGGSPLGRFLPPSPDY
jgi:hypothetical protein